MKKQRTQWEVTVTCVNRRSARGIARDIGGKIRRVTIKKDIPGTPEFLALIERVRKIDPKAAEYMEVPHDGINETRVYGALSSWAVWAYTPQGDAYWNNIEGKLLNGS